MQRYNSEKYERLSVITDLFLSFQFQCYFEFNFNFYSVRLWHFKLQIGGGGGGPTTKKIMPPGKPQDVLCLFCSFLFFFVLFQNTFKIDVFVPNLVKNVSSKKIIIFVFFDLFCSFLLFSPVFVSKMSSNREQKRTKKIMPPAKSKDVLCLFYCWTPPPPPNILLL